jgi:6-pyruvoyltetrahydropterin/6-carboxytetrahydropterin synthase
MNQVVSDAVGSLAARLSLPLDQYSMSTKTFAGYPCAHRQPLHKGHCALVHGYSRSFTFIFQSQTLDECGFVVDFGSLKWVKQYLDHMFDHTLLLVPDDPLMDHFRAIEAGGGAMIRLMPHGVGMEGTARLITETVDHELRARSKGRCWVLMVESRENEKNSGIYVNPEAGFRGWL